MPKLPACLSTCPNCQQRSLTLKHRMKAYCGGAICINCSSKLKLSRMSAILWIFLLACVQLPATFLLWLVLAQALPKTAALTIAITLWVAAIEASVILTARFKSA